jgi:hypothetical protein
MGLVKLFMKLSILSVALFVSGCGNNPFGNGPSTVSPGYGPPSIPTLPSATNIGVISGSLQSATTSVNTNVSVSAGSPTSKLKYTASNGATVFLSVQGQMVSK